MRILGIVPMTGGSIIELESHEHEALGVLFRALHKDKYPPNEDHTQEIANEAFGLIAELGKAIDQQSLSDESIKNIVLKATEAKEWKN